MLISSTKPGGQNLGDQGKGPSEGILRKLLADKERAFLQKKRQQTRLRMKRQKTSAFDPGKA